ncbi:hypothetical protein Mgra_00000731, partial [Meloidogyne graminicola]
YIFQRFYSNKSINSIIFDLDGVIIDSETIYYKINKKSLAHFGVEYSMELKRGQMGRKLSEGVDYLLEETKLRDRGVKSEDYLAVYDKFFNEEINSTDGGWPLMTGANKLITHLHESKIKMALCTGSTSKEFPKKIGKCKELIEKMNTVVLSVDDSAVKSGKPSPDPYLVTIRRMFTHPSLPPIHHKNILVIEDSIHGVNSAISAGCKVCWIPQMEFYSLDELEYLESRIKKEDVDNLFVERINSLKEFIPEKYGLPSF